MRFSLSNCSHEAPVDVRHIDAQFGSIPVDASDQIVLLVRHNPGAGGISVIPRASIPEIGGFHGAVVVITAVDLGIAVVEAAAGVVVETDNDPVLSLRLVIDCCALGIILAQSHSGLDENTVGFVSHYGNRRHVGEWEVVKSAERRAAESTA